MCDQIFMKISGFCGLFLYDLHTYVCNQIAPVYEPMEHEPDNVDTLNIMLIKTKLRSTWQTHNSEDLDNTPLLISFTTCSCKKKPDHYIDAFIN